MQYYDDNEREREQEREAAEREELQRQLSQNTGITGTRTPAPQQETFQKYNGGSAEDYMRSKLDGHAYGPEELGQMEGEFKKHGLTVMRASDGGVRGRVIDDQTGDFWDVLDPNESMHWWSNKTGEKYNVGGRQKFAPPSFGGGRGGGGGSSRGQSPTFSDPSIQGINGLMPTDTDFFKTLQDRLQDILGGPAMFERDALLRQLGGK